MGSRNSPPFDGIRDGPGSAGGLHNAVKKRALRAGRKFFLWAISPRWTLGNNIFVLLSTPTGYGLHVPASSVRSEPVSYRLPR